MEQVSRLHDYVALTAQKKELENQLKAIKEQIEAVEPDVLGYMQDNGMQSVNVSGYTVYLRRDIRATFTETDEALKVISAMGFDDALKTTIPPARASSIVREQIKDLAPDEEVPEWIKTAFNYFDGISPAIRKS